MFKIIIIALAITVITIVTLSVVENANNATTSQNENEASDKSGKVTVAISGEITRPGTYYIDSGATLLDAIEKASGTTSNADYLCFNGDYVITINTSFYIAPIYDNGDTCAVTPIAKVNINTANKSDLMGISGFGDSIAQAIIDYREQTSLFHRLEDIKNVTGVGEATFTKVKDKIRLKDA